MTKLTYILIASIMLLSCEDLFHEPETSIGDIQNYNQLFDAAEGTWNKLNWAVNYPTPLGFYFQNLKADDLTYKGTSYDTYYPDREYRNYVSESSIFNYRKHPNYLYESFYLVITSANNIIAQFPTPSEDDKSIQHIIGEMLLLRAYCHFRLTRTYGQIPIVKDIDVDFSLNKPNFVQIYEFIESDLRRAENLLPLTSQSSRTPGKRPGKGTAKALLAEVYLSWAGYPVNDGDKYSSAAKEAGELIEGDAVYGFELLSDFANVWDKEYEINKESILCLYFAENERITDYNQINLLYSLNDSYMRGSSFHSPPFRRDPETSIGYSGFVVTTFYATEVNFYNHYPSGYRKDVTFFTDIYVDEDYYFEFQADTGLIHIDTISIYDRAGYRKFYEEGCEYYLFDDNFKLYGRFDNPSGYFRGDLNLINKKIYLYRFAHMLLTYAEAKARSGQLDESAYEAVNRIRRRANNVDQFAPSKYDLTPGLSAEVFADSVVWERAWELAGEPEGRYFDLLRLEKLEDLRNYRHPQEMSPPWKSITRDEYFLPIPEEDAFLNSNFNN